ncbi:MULTISPECIES: hypothetical protein [Streptomyces]|uniref:hypothetical protein n=1 Tax=Streptomyces TaxID=1883 RepID=UPI000464E2F8|nr:hypothetical protein [Streptomyces exfoliatus]
MAEVTTEDLSIQIAGLRHYLSKIDHAPLPTTEWMKQQLAPVNKLIEELKAQQDKVAEEVVKPTWEQVMEKLGLGPVAEIIKKGIEGGIGAALIAGIVALGGIIVPLLMIALGAFLVFQLQKWHAGRNANNETVGMRADGSFGRRNFQDIQNERNGVAGGGIADLPATANFDALRNQLTLLNPHLETFNKHAPDFVANFKKLPSEGKATKAAKGVKAVAEAVENVNHQAMPLVASGMGKINGAVKNSDPKKTVRFADGIGKLKLAMTGLDVDKVPKAGTLGQAADAAHRLAEKTGTLAQKMRDFAREVNTINQELGGAATT